MKIKCLLFTVLFVISQVVVAQNDTITGILLDINQKAIKNYPVALGRVSPVKVKTDKNGFFTIPGANLQDSLFVADKKGKNVVAIPVNGFRFVVVQSLTGNFNTNYLSEPDERLIRYVESQIKQNDRKKSTSYLNREDIERSGCRDVRCLLRRFSGVVVSENAITIRGNASLQGGVNSALIVIDGIPGGTIDSIPIDDIEEISVLRDASIYGVRGANGAVVIRTRR